MYTLAITASKRTSELASLQPAKQKMCFQVSGLHGVYQLCEHHALVVQAYQIIAQGLSDSQNILKAVCMAYNKSTLQQTRQHEM